MKKIPPIKKLTEDFLGNKKVESKVVAVVDVVSFVTVICDPYLKLILLSILFSKVKSEDPIGI